MSWPPPFAALLLAASVAGCGKHERLPWELEARLVALTVASPDAPGNDGNMANLSGTADFWTFGPPVATGMESHIYDTEYDARFGKDSVEVTVGVTHVAGCSCSVGWIGVGYQDVERTADCSRSADPLCPAGCWLPEEVDATCSTCLEDCTSCPADTYTSFVVRASVDAVPTNKCIIQSIDLELFGRPWPEGDRP